MRLKGAQDLIRKTYIDKDSKRGIDGTFMYLIEEVGELSTALREETDEECASEFADVLAWLMSLANLKGIDLENAFITKYSKCSRCHQIPCECKSKA